jgi:ornithine lipid ester-linked acyl 2-hydroxylase
MTLSRARLHRAGSAMAGTRREGDPLRIPCRPARCVGCWVHGYMHGGGWTIFGLYASAADPCRVSANGRCAPTGPAVIDGRLLEARTTYARQAARRLGGERLQALIVPSGCRLRVGNETRFWLEGRCLIFDDTTEHEAWNDSEFARGMLLLDFLRPGFNGSVADHEPEEVQQYAARLFAAKAGRS